jgi:O-antigen/teichoic acid export membrane protein
MQDKKKIIVDSFFMSGAFIFSFIFGIPASIISAKLLGPALLGVLKILNLIQNYSSYTPLGFMQGLSRECSIQIGQKKYKEAEETKNIAITYLLVLLLLNVIAILICYWIGLFESKSISFNMIVLIIIIIILGRIREIISTYLMVNSKFRIISLNHTINGFIMPVLTIVLLIYYKVEGILFAAVLATTVCTILYYRTLKKIGFKYRLNFNLTRGYEIWKPNFLIYLNNVSGKLLWSIDLLLITIFLSLTEVGIYGVALGAVKIATNFSNSANKPILRRINIERGKYGLNNLQWLRPYFEKPLTVYMFYSCLWIGLLCISYIWLIEYYLTEYTYSIVPLLILSAGGMIYSSMPIFGFFISVTGRFKVMIISKLCFVFFNLILDTILIKFGYGINSVAIVSSLSYAFYIIFITIYVFKQVYDDPMTKVAGFLLRVFTHSLFLIAFIISYYSVINGETVEQNPVIKIPELVIVNASYVILLISSFSSIFMKQRIHREFWSITKTILDGFILFIKKKRSTINAARN